MYAFFLAYAIVLVYHCKLAVLPAVLYIAGQIRVTEKHKMKSIAVIGGGASGILAAIFAASNKCRVTLFEKQKSIGRKILATGNGRCNLTNRQIDTSHYHGKNPKFTLNIFSRFGLNDTIEFFESAGIPLIEEKDGRMFPESLHAPGIVKILKYELSKRNIDILLNRKIEKIMPEKKGINLITAGREEHVFDSVILSAGSCAYPQLGASRAGYDLASSLGHRIIEPFPAILPLNIIEKEIRRMEGIKRICKIKTGIGGIIRAESTGDLLFTKFGISGTAALDVSRAVNAAAISGGNPKIIIDFFPDMQLHEFLRKIERLFIDRKKESALCLTGILQSRMAEVLLSIAGVNPLMPAGDITENDIKNIAETLKSLKLSAGEPRSFKEAVTAAGGVDVNEINPATMESKIIKNLFITGELLDIDGDSGGYNLQFAWSTGAVAGMAQKS